MIEKLRNYFDEMVVYKDLKKSNFFSALSLPSFMRDWLLRKFEDEHGVYNSDDVAEFVHKYLPRKDSWIEIKSRVVTEREQVRLLAKVAVDIDIKTGEVSFALPDFGLTNKETVIEDAVWESCKDDLIRGGETWGMIEIGYRAPDDYEFAFSKNKAKGAKQGRIRLVSFKAFCPYIIDSEYYKEARKEFTITEWIDVLLGAADYNAGGYLLKTASQNDYINFIDPEEKKLTMLTRLLPFVEKRLNLIELAPKGTGKSYLFGRVSRFGWLSSGGVMSRAKMFYDQSKRMTGLVSGNDFVVLDEVQTISFSNADEMRAALKGYLEAGVFTVGNYEGTADAGIVLCGNIGKDTMEDNGYSNMFEELPVVFHESALIDRFHGFIKGWDIPRMNDDLKVSGWALNSEYFCSILHALRDDMSYRTVVDELVVVPEAADTRDTEAVKRIATAYLKLLFPNVRTASDIATREFKRYCLDRASRMRSIIKVQLGILDSEYRGKDIPAFAVKTDASSQRQEDDELVG